MFINTIRLEFNNIFPEEEQKEILTYLKEVSKDVLLNIIGFSNTYPQLNYDNFFRNSDVKKDIIKRVSSFCIENKIINKPSLISRESSLVLAEIILSNKDSLFINDNNDIDKDEINIFKSFLIINQQLNQKLIFDNSDLKSNKLRIANFCISSTFSSADIGGTIEQNEYDLGKVIYCTIKKFKILVQFLESNKEYNYLIKAIYESFDLNDISEVVLQMKYLFSQILILKTKNSYKFEIDDNNQRAKVFLNSFISNKIDIDNNYINLRSHPIYKIDDNTYSIIDYFFIVDKFNKSLKFILKSSYNKKNNLKENSRDFFNFFNTKFSEEYLMKNILNEIYQKKYFTKKTENSNKPNEPDYYLRHNKCILIFENKDVLIGKDVKSSSNIKKILNVLKIKFFEDNGKTVGIGQLVKSIDNIISQKFDFDEYVNNKRNFTIYPILLVHDRELEVPGINYVLNQWYRESIKKKLKNNYNPNKIKDLIIIDIDTIIFGLEYFKRNDSNLKDFMENHLKQMNLNKKPYGRNFKELEDSTNKNLMNNFSPISYRFLKQNFDSNLLRFEFEDLINQ